MPGAAGQGWLGAVADRGARDLLRDTAALLVVCAGGLILLATATPLLVVVGALVAGLGWGWQALATLAVVNQHPEAPGVAVGIEMTGFFAGAVVGPLLVGFLSNHASFSVARLACAGLALLAAAAAAALGARRPELAS